jgi:hypothetical protein
LKQQADIAKAQRKSQSDAMKGMLDSAVNIYGANKGDADTIVDNLKSRVLQMEPQLGQQASQRLVAALDDPQGRKAILAELGGAWSQLEKKTKAGAVGKGTIGAQKGSVRVFQDEDGNERRVRLMTSGPVGMVGKYIEEGTNTSVDPRSKGWVDITAKKHMAEAMREAEAESTLEFLTKKKDDADQAYQRALSIQAGVDQFEELRKFASTGSARDLIDGLSSVMQAFGYRNTEQGVRQAMDAITMDFAAARFDATKGAISDKEFMAFMRSVPNASMTPEGLSLVLSMQAQYADWATRRHEFISSLDAGMGRSDISKAEREWDELNPAFDKEKLREVMRISKKATYRQASFKTLLNSLQAIDGDQPNAASKDAPSIGDTVDEYKFTGGDPADPSSWSKL